MNPVRMRSEPTAAEISNWNKHARQPSTTWVRSGYNTYLTVRKFKYLWDVAKMAEPSNLIRASVQALAVPIAEKTGSETFKTCAYVASEGLAAIFSPITWCAGKAFSYVGTKAAEQIVASLDIENPECRDLVDVLSSELATYSAGAVGQKISQAHKNNQQRAKVTSHKVTNVARRVEPAHPKVQRPIPKGASLKIVSKSISKGPLQKTVSKILSKSPPKTASKPIFKSPPKIASKPISKSPLPKIVSKILSKSPPKIASKPISKSPLPKIVSKILSKSPPKIASKPIFKSSPKIASKPTSKSPLPKIVSKILSKSPPKIASKSISKSPPPKIVPKALSKSPVPKIVPPRVQGASQAGQRKLGLRPRIVSKIPGRKSEPGVERPGVERPGVERPGVERPGIERPDVRNIRGRPSREKEASYKDKLRNLKERGKSEEKNSSGSVNPAPGAGPQIASAEQKVTTANQKVSNLNALSGYSAIDMENVATQFYNDARNLQSSGVSSIPYIEKQLSEKYGIPMGTLTDSLTNAFQSRHPDERVPARIASALASQQSNGNARVLAQQELDQATSQLQQLKEPKSVEPNLPAPTPQPQNILQMVTDSENRATQSGLQGNVFVQMRDLAITLSGSDHGQQYEQMYSAFYQGYEEWQRYKGNDKPTQYGFLTSVTDLLVNGTTTVPVETNHRHWYQNMGQFLGSIGIGFQTNGNTLQLGTQQHPNLVTVAPSALTGTAFSSTDGHTAANGAGQALKNLDAVSGLEGLGTYLHGAVDKVTSVIGTLERIDDPDFQDKPAGEKIGCAVWGTAIERTGEAIVGTIGGVAGVAAAAAVTPFAENAGDNAQQNCHDVIDMAHAAINSAKSS